MYGYENYTTMAIDSTDIMSSTDAVGMVGALAAFGAVTWIIAMAISIFMIVTMWKLFKKAGKPGWASIIPIYNFVVLLDIAGLAWWYLLLLMVPFVNFFVLFYAYIKLAHAFGKGTGFGIATVFFSIICLPILAFGSAEYQG